MSVAVLGAGAFGTALAISLGRAVLWARAGGAAMQASRENTARLPGITLPDALHVTGDLARAIRAEILLLAIPTQSLRGFLTENADALGGKTLVACCKGAEIGSGLGPVGIIRDMVPGANAAILTGPSFAADIARGLPTALTLACADPALAVRLQEALTTANLRLYRTTDVAGAEMGGALKNVMAIACGTVIGAGLGESARAALMTRGYAEMLRYATTRGARPETLAGLSGLGDLALTCMSDQSRNYRRGLALGRGEGFDTGTTVEGAATAAALVAGGAELDLPITSAVLSLLEGRATVEEAMTALLARPLKEE